MEKGMQQENLHICFHQMRMHGWLNSKHAGEYRVVNVQDNNSYY